MTVLGAILLVLACIWFGVAVAFWLFGRAGEQGLFFGMLGRGMSEKDSNAFVAKTLRHQRAEGRVAKVLWRAWPVALAALVAGLVLLASSKS